MAKQIGYARVSSREQAENSHALEQQMQRLRVAGVEEIYSDVESGTKDDRKGFNLVMDLVRSRAIDEVVITRLDRFTRSLITLRKVLDEFRENGVNMKALDDSVDLSTAAGKFHLNMLGALAEMEVDRLSERVRHGWSHLRKRQVAMNPPFGYVKLGDKHCLDHEPCLCLLDTRQERSRAEIAREIVETFLTEKTLRKCLRVINQKYGIYTFSHNQGPHRRGGRAARGLFHFSPGGLREWLINPVLQGHLCYLRKQDGQRLPRQDWTIHHNTHPDQRMVSDEESRKIEAILQHNQRVRGFGSTALKYPLSGLVICGECRSSCYSLTGQRNYHRAKRLGIEPEINYYFQCKNWRMRSCNQKSVVRMEKVEIAVIEALVSRAGTISATAEATEEQVDPPELQALKVELAYYLNAPGSRAAVIVADLKQQIDAYRHKQQASTTLSSGQRDLLLQTFGDPLYWKTLTPEQKRDLYRELVERVIVRDGQVERVELRV
ncbi:fdxN element excision recombinase XisF [Phormidium sp. FACHB-1136]|uniref:fdxN element excision recombinase XisF n=1 Tax=Phormidium sp. FACHB-1136 TaxID=2692848 RepID=UPI0016892AC5|nr:fdxN element excision recombinase XisF [Phormidium sp. FACHB-1136]MBD2425370.1 recombinase family protein [Phormidium sp. FACHB-1136]